MKNIFKYYALIWIIMILLFNAIVFVVPNEVVDYNKLNSAFWLSCIFIMIAFIGQLASVFYAFKANNLRQLFYNIPLITLSYSGLIFMLISGVVSMVVPGFPRWIAVIINMSILAFSVIAVLKAKVASEVVWNVDENTKTKTFFIKSLTVDSKNLLTKVKSDVIKTEARKIYEAVHFSDPISSDVLEPIELQITKVFSEFAKVVVEDDKYRAKILTEEILILINERNNKCKLLK